MQRETNLKLRWGKSSPEHEQDKLNEDDNGKQQQKLAVLDDDNASQHLIGENSPHSGTVQKQKLVIDLS
jgi:hypothetical protein